VRDRGPVVVPEEQGPPLETHAMAIPLILDAGPTLAEEDDASADEGESDEGPADAGRTSAGGGLPGPARVRHGNGKLNVVTTLKGEPYWASVLVDGTRRGTTPMLLELPSGRHVLRIERMGFKPVSRQVKVGIGRTSMVRLELKP